MIGGALKQIFTSTLGIFGIFVAFSGPIGAKTHSEVDSSYRVFSDD